MTVRRALSRIGGSIRLHHVSIVGAALLAAAAVLTWQGFRATEEWSRSARLLMEERTSEVVTLMIMALNRDMRGAETEVLPQMETLDTQTSLYELSDEVTVAFARFPYPESFFSWTSGGTDPVTLYVLNRTDRKPAWDTGKATTVEFPTTISRDPGALRPLIAQLQQVASRGSRTILLETKINGQAYQVVARPRYGGPSGANLQGLVGFTVNLNWVRAHYFVDLISQLSRVLPTSSTSIALSIVDDHGTTVTSNWPSGVAPGGALATFREQRFPLLFVDPILRTRTRGASAPIQYWVARAEVVEDKSTLTAAGGARQNYALIAIAALAATAALIFGIRSARSAALLAAMKSEFVSAVTHELKTPLASIRLASETLVRGRYRSQEVIAQYAEMLLKDVSRLTHTVENLLAITRVQDVHGFYLFEAVDLVTVIEESLSRFQLQLQERGFELLVDVPATLPAVHADRASILQVLDNLLDNAIRYSNGNRKLSVTASAGEKQVSLRITDSGPGIPSDELPRVFDKFFRGRGLATSGSGLGLAIAQRLIHDQGGAIRLHSSQGSGTTAEVLLCCAKEEAYETKDSGGRR